MTEECANPLWLLWMQEWLDEAKTKNLRSATTLVCIRSHALDLVGLCALRRLKKACDALKICPLPMVHPSEAQALNGFGPKTCEKLEKKLKKHCEENGLPMPKRKGSFVSSQFTIQ